MNSPAELKGDIDALLALRPAPWKLEPAPSSGGHHVLDELGVMVTAVPMGMDKLWRGIVASVNFYHWVTQPLPVKHESLVGDSVGRMP